MTSGYLTQYDFSNILTLFIEFFFLLYINIYSILKQKKKKTSIVCYGRFNFRFSRIFNFVDTRENARGLVRQKIVISGKVIQLCSRGENEKKKKNEDTSTVIS